ncbi:unnamed protein product, partial [Mesorhabditis spiculigera]
MCSQKDKTIAKLEADFAWVPRDVEKKDMTTFLKNGPKNRSPDVPCVDKSRVILWHKGPNYIHANKLYPSFESILICAQLPTSETVDDHWLMILQADCRDIITLSDPSESGKFTPYWPTRENPVKKFGDFKIQWESTNDYWWFLSRDEVPKSNYAVKRSTYEVWLDGKKIRNIEHYHCTDWPAGGVTRDLAGPIELLEDMSLTRQPILIESLLGVGRPGVLALLKHALDHVKSDMHIGPLEDNLRSMRELRAHLVETPWQFIYVYMALLQHFEQLPGRGFTDEMKKKFKDEWAPAYHKYAKEAEAQLKRDAAKKK